MKKILLLAILLAAVTGVKAQQITHTKEWTTLVNSLESEDWPTANKLSLSLLKTMPADGSDEVAAAMLRYMYIYSEAGLMNTNKATKAEALKKVADLKGKMIVLPAHPVALKNGFNSIRLANNSTDTLAITSTNKAATSIFAFEYIILNTKWPLADFQANEGKIWRLGGNIKSITVEGNMLPRFRIMIEQGIANEEQ